MIDDQSVAVLGGLIQDSFTDGSDRVPLVGDLPLIGAFFRYDARKRQKVNLLVFLKPTVVRSRRAGPRDPRRALRLHHGRAAQEPARVPLLLERPDSASAAPPGACRRAPPRAKSRTALRHGPGRRRPSAARPADRHAAAGPASRGATGTAAHMEARAAQATTADRPPGLRAVGRGLREHGSPTRSQGARRARRRHRRRRARRPAAPGRHSRRRGRAEAGSAAAARDAQWNPTSSPASSRAPTTRLHPRPRRLPWTSRARPTSRG